MDKSTNQPLIDSYNIQITSEQIFIPEKRNGEIELIFNLDASILIGKEIVVFETLYRGNREVATHHDIKDLNQTVKFTNPKIKTKFTTNKHEKELKANGKVKFVDHVKYTELIYEEEYIITLTVMNKTKNSFVLNEKGNILRVEKTFIANGTEGLIPVEVVLNTDQYIGNELVAFEELSYKNEVIAKHKDINDKGQTVIIKDPIILNNPKTGDYGILQVIILFVTSSIGYLLILIKKESNKIV